MARGWVLLICMYVCMYVCMSMKEREKRRALILQLELELTDLKLSYVMLCYIIFCLYLECEYGIWLLFLFFSFLSKADLVMYPMKKREMGMGEKGGGSTSLCAL